MSQELWVLWGRTHVDQGRAVRNEGTGRAMLRGAGPTSGRGEGGRGWQLRRDDSEARPLCLEQLRF